MQAPEQHEFDAGVSFDFNTGAIHRASWGEALDGQRRPATIRAALAKWNKGGGKVLPGLVKRRHREAEMLLHGSYPGPDPALAAQERRPPGILGDCRSMLPNGGKCARNSTASAIRSGPGLTRSTARAVIGFQRDHGLTQDGIIGRATLSTCSAGSTPPHGGSSSRHAGLCRDRHCHRRLRRHGCFARC